MNILQAPNNNKKKIFIMLISITKKYVVNFENNVIIRNNQCRSRHHRSC